MLKVGSKAPSFTLQTDEGKTVSLKDFAGKKVVLYFYPKDDTPGCTKEACSFTENSNALKKAGAVVLGVSADSVNSHQKFKNKYNLNFPLLSDPDRSTIEKYAVWKEKNMYGKKTMGIERTTFIIDEEGKIAHVFPKVKVDGHTEEVLQKLKE
ncbi:MAG TPA: thioredoxin-dependent thiol peroxidase [Acidobacteriota bacterium]|jgi:peroxiredoxin Q/BCP|nr:thioredoxin-dependent thiol peroxidase [Acidobacteriota bacterium]